tara:strand:- start:491 stop:637 length:147 start_codon:yes stop_codon:yes gene_type:complete
VVENNVNLKDSTIEFVNSEPDSGKMKLVVTGGVIYSATSWKINFDGNI